MSKQSRRVLLCADLDRTVLPNGADPEPPAARRAFRLIAAPPQATLYYVTGGHRALIEAAIEELAHFIPEAADWFSRRKDICFTDAGLQPPAHRKQFPARAHLSREKRAAHSAKDVCRERKAK